MFKFNCQLRVDLPGDETQKVFDKENLNVKDNKVNTIQKAEELKKLFSPGNAFGFNAVLELEETKTDTSS
ncbi:hypothetical protein GH714_004790 [Hevea brasiliensis]|uniref:Uncharacterized protein n=1 Tax=Hevea brasiliensis TaxID=3981 RepID=A0A6A6N6Z1_HEVBR|nr:hypothetical protein GH714_004790 [Hevea brasiliensis]